MSTSVTYQKSIHLRVICAALVARIHARFAANCAFFVRNPARFIRIQRQSADILECLGFSLYRLLARTPLSRSSSQCCHTPFGSFLPKHYAGMQRTTFPQPQNIKVNFVSFFPIQAIDT
jgi:hypothetical protein